jgi:hypothetical protein
MALLFRQSKQVKESFEWSKVPYKKMEQTKVDLVLKDEDDQWGFQWRTALSAFESTLGSTL